MIFFCKTKLSNFTKTSVDADLLNWCLYLRYRKHIMSCGKESSLIIRGLGTRITY